MDQAVQAYYRAAAVRTEGESDDALLPFPLVKYAGEVGSGTQAVTVKG
jgi:hypothetical protein